MTKLFRGKVFLLLLALCLFAAAAAEAAFVPDSKESPTEKITTVEEAKKLPDDTRVVLHGYIVKHIRSDHYMFQDDTGSISIEIDDDDWNGVTVGPADRVEIRGEIDRDPMSLEIEVEYIRKLTATQAYNIFSSANLYFGGC